ncbi:unnamed protein product [Alopecurus aequalis]
MTLPLIHSCQTLFFSSIVSGLASKMVDYEEEARKYVQGLAEAFMGKLGVLLVQEIHLILGVRGEVVLLRDDAAMMNALLRMFSEADHDVVDHFVREWMKQVRELAYDGEDCIDLFVRHISLLPAPRKNDWCGCIRHHFDMFVARWKLGNDLKALRARAIAISERRTRYGVYGQALHPSEAFGARVPMSSTPPVFDGANHDPSQFVGMEDQIEKVSKILNPPPPEGGGGTEQKKLKVCSIVGTGGVGKSTLAMCLFRSFRDFHYRAIVSVSQHFDLDGLMKGIHKAFRFEGSTDTEFAQHLVKKRYLIVLDDVWTTSAWSEIKPRLPENNMGSRIIVTTRIENVATACSTHSSDSRYIHHAKLLNDEESKALFVRRVFGKPIPDGAAAPQNDGQPIPVVAVAAHNGGCPDQLQAKMDIILKKCNGLPLAIVCIANVLASYNSPASIEMWTRVCSSVGSQLETNSAVEGMMRVIALSYNHLPHHLKACTMLLSIFPHGYHIPKWRLVRRWISEGLIPEKRGLTLLEVAEAYFDELMSRNMIQQVLLKDGSPSVGHCCVHDIMHEVIVSNSLEENFVSLVGSPRGGTSSDPVRRLCVHGGVGYVADGRSMQHVRSLTTFGHNINDIVKLLDGLAKFTLLRVLDLEDCQDVTNEHMKQVCRLFLLRFLNLNGTKISALPGEISNLRHLQSLMLWDTQLDEVPGSVVNLEKLEHLTFQKENNPDIRMILPRGLRKMKALQHLVRIQIGYHDVELANEIGDLVQLRELGVVVVQCTHPSHTNDDVRRALQRSVDKLKLCSLRQENIDIEYQ